MENIFINKDDLTSRINKTKPRKIKLGLMMVFRATLHFELHENKSNLQKKSHPFGGILF